MTASYCVTSCLPSASRRSLSVYRSLLAWRSIAYYWLTGWSQLRISGHIDATALVPPPRGGALTSPSRDGVVDGGPSHGILYSSYYTGFHARAYIWIIGLLQPVQVLKSHLRLIRGSMILDHIWTPFLGGRLICESDLYASIYGTFAATELMFFWHTKQHFVRCCSTEVALRQFLRLCTPYTLRCCQYHSSIDTNVSNTCTSDVSLRCDAQSLTWTVKLMLW